MKNKLIITQIEQLSLLQSTTTFDQIEVNFPNLNKDLNKYWSQKLEKAYYACGCTAGYRFMVIGCIVAVLYAIFSYNSFMVHPLISSGKLFLFVILMAVVGKGLGLLFAKIQLKSYIDTLKKMPAI